MFHVSTKLPFTEGDPQQVHIQAGSYHLAILPTINTHKALLHGLNVYIFGRGYFSKWIWGFFSPTHSFKGRDI